MHEEQAAEPAAPEESGRRRSRAAATHAKQAMSRLNDPGEDMDYNPATPAPVQTFATPTRGRGSRGGGRRGGGGAGRGRPPGTTRAAMEERRKRYGGSEMEVDRRPKLGRRVASEVLPEDESSLYFIIRNGKASLQQTVDDWIDSYKSDRDSALLSLMQFFISASGCKGKCSTVIVEACNAL